jgi:hypothetical protein
LRARRPRSLRRHSGARRRREPGNQNRHRSRIESGGFVAFSFLVFLEPVIPGRAAGASPESRTGDGAGSGAAVSLRYHVEW